MDTQAFFPANRELPGDRDGGHESRSRTPLAGTLFAASLAVVVARACPRCGSTSCGCEKKADEADESIPDTKGRESWTPKYFPLQIGSFLGTATGGHDGDRGPLWPAPLPIAPP
jgi:hypothetical protein